MKPTLAKISIKAALKAGKPIFLHGSPGVGKSSIVNQVCAELGNEIADVRTTLLEPVDLRGLPHVADGKTVWARPVFLPDHPKMTLFLDELTSAEQSVQAACYQLVLDKRVGEHALPADCGIIAAGNKQSDRAHTNRMPTALANRLIHIEIEPDLNDWIMWGLSNTIRTELIAFMMFRPDALFCFDPRKDERAFASPRSWETVSRLLDALPVTTAEEQAVLTAMINGTVGEGMGTEFSAFLATYKDLPNPKQALLNPKTAKIPQTPAGLYAVCASLCHHVDPNTVDNFFEYIGRMGEEFQTLAVKLATWKRDDICNSRSFIKWGTEHQGAFIA